MWSYRKPHSLLVEMQIDTITLALLHDPAIVILGIDPKELKTYSLNNLTQKCIATLFIKAKPWKQSRHPSEGECINCGTIR